MLTQELKHTLFRVADNLHRYDEPSYVRAALYKVTSGLARGAYLTRQAPVRKHIEMLVEEYCGRR